MYRSLKNAITIDVEDWFHVCGWDAGPPVAALERRVLANIERVLSLLAEYDVRATFFVLGSVAEEQPSLVPLIVSGGHEIASHGYSHRLVSELGVEGFRDEIRRTGDILGRQSGRMPIGFRAPQWSLRQTDSWAFDILRNEGYRYDSSLNPLPFLGDRSGHRFPFEIRAGAGKILEIPPMVTPFPAGNLPTGGGWGFRFFPCRLIGATVRRYNRDGNPAVFYLHPREMEADGPRLPMSSLRSFAVYGARREVGTRLRYLLERFRFGTLEQMVESWESV
ncbi:MAG: polysaccharide deacetylase family protein [Geobacteraceae bacterium]|nr:polysaccharide deacetylase family protein [Geobacteraceae bacterium]